MASLTQWTRVWANSKRQLRTGKPGVLQSMGSQRVGHNLASEQQYKQQLPRYRKTERKLNCTQQALHICRSCIWRCSWWNPWMGRLQMLRPTVLHHFTQGTWAFMDFGTNRGVLKPPATPISKRSQSEKAMILTVGLSGKGNYGDSERSAISRGWG